MRDKWYADNRDLVKWATLAHIASAHGMRTIVQVPYWRPEESRPHFDLQGKQLPVSDQVWGFLRNIHNINGLAPEIGVSINVISAEFNSKNRAAYVSEVQAQMDQSRRPLLLFLDPDTGLQPKKCSPKHAAINEIVEFWYGLRHRDWLVLYQHARRTTGW